MNTSEKHDHGYSFDNLVIFSCKSIGLLLLSIGGLCGLIVLYGFFQYLLALAIG